jgi:alpha-mannosidase
VLVCIGQPPAPRLDLPLPEVLAMQQAAEAEVRLASTAITVVPGGQAVIELQVSNLAASAIRGEAQLISPYGSWQRVRPWTTGFAAPAGGATSLQFRVTAPGTARPGEQWWALVKLMYFGRLIYTEPVEVTVITSAG